MAIHVLQFFSTLNSGGAENRMMDIYRQIDPNIVIFDFAVLHSGEHAFDKEIMKNGSQKYVLPDPRKGLLKNYLALRKFFRNHSEFVAVHAHMNWYSGVVLLAAKHAGIQYRVAHARSLFNKKRGFKDKVFCAIGKVLIGLVATKRMAISEDAAMAIFGKRVIKQTNYQFVPNSIDENKYSVLNVADRASIRRLIGIPEGKMALVNVANFRSPKNHDFLIEIAASLKRKHYPFVLYLIGEGDLRNVIETKVSKLDLDDSVIFLGHRADVPQILGAFDVMVFPSLYEGLGGVVLEAQLVGIPAIVSTGIPREADVGIDMVEFVSLEENASVWADRIIWKCNHTLWNYEKAIEAFNSKGYNILSTARIYLKSYGLDDSTVQKALRGD